MRVTQWHSGTVKCYKNDITVSSLVALVLLRDPSWYVLYGIFNLSSHKHKFEILVLEGVVSQILVLLPSSALRSSSNP